MSDRTDEARIGMDTGEATDPCCDGMKEAIRQGLELSASPGNAPALERIAINPYSDCDVLTPPINFCPWCGGRVVPFETNAPAWERWRANLVDYAAGRAK